MKTLVIYYSLTGKTRVVARAIAESLNATLVEITETKLRKPGLRVYLIGGFAAFSNKGSVIKPLAVDVSQYDRVFVGSPVWASRPAPAINAFIYQTALAGRTVIPFVTLRGNSPAAALNNLSVKVQKRGGKVEGSFAVTTNQVPDDEIVRLAKDAVKQYSG